MSSKSKIVIIAALDLKGGFSKNGELPFNSKADMKHFKQTTLGNVCVMGRKTYDGIVARTSPKEGEQALPGRDCYVYTSKPEEVQYGTGFSDLGAIPMNIGDERTFFFIGGESIFNLGLQLADEAIITVFDEDYECDKFFPTDYLDDHFNIVSNEKLEDCVVLTFKRK